MNSTTKSDRYSSSLISLHWIMVLLIAGVFAAAELRGYYPRGSDTRELLKSLHYTLGLTVLSLVLVRLVVRSRTSEPEIVPAQAPWQTALARLVHVVLYVAMLGMPLLGWLILSGEGHATPFYGASLPPLMGENKDLAHSIEGVHEFIGNALYFVIGLHALAALAHHYVFRDNTLTRMLPARR